MYKTLRAIIGGAVRTWMIWGLVALTNLDGKGGSFMPWISSLEILEYLQGRKQLPSHKVYIVQWSGALAVRRAGDKAQDVEFSESPERDPARSSGF